MHFCLLAGEVVCKSERNRLVFYLFSVWSCIKCRLGALPHSCRGHLIRKFCKIPKTNVSKMKTVAMGPWVRCRCTFAMCADLCTPIRTIVRLISVVWKSASLLHSAYPQTFRVRTQKRAFIHLNFVQSIDLRTRHLRFAFRNFTGTFAPHITVETDYNTHWLHANWICSNPHNVRCTYVRAFIQLCLCFGRIYWRSWQFCLRIETTTKVKINARIVKWLDSYELNGNFVVKSLSKCQRQTFDTMLHSKLWISVCDLNRNRYVCTGVGFVAPKVYF